MYWPLGRNGDKGIEYVVRLDKTLFIKSFPYFLEDDVSSTPSISFQTFPQSGSKRTERGRRNPKASPNMKREETHLLNMSSIELWFGIRIEIVVRPYS